MQPIQTLRNLARAAWQKPRHVAVATAMLVGGPAAVAWGASSAGASPTNGEGDTPSTLVIDEGTSTTQAPVAETVPEAPAAEPVTVDSTPTSEVESGHPQEPVCEDDGIGYEMDDCPAPTSTTTSTTTTTTHPTTTSSTTTTTHPEEVCDDELNVAFRAAFDEEFEKIARYRGYESYEDIPADVIAQIDWEAFWNTALAMKNQFGFEDQQELLHELALCDICPPHEPPTTTTTTTHPTTTTTLIIPTTTSTTTTTAPTTTSTTTTTAPTTTSSTTTTTLIIPGETPTTTAPPASYPMGPGPTLPGAPTGTLARTGAGGILGLAQTGGGLFVVGTAAAALAARRKAEKARASNGIKVVSTGGPDPDLDPIEFELEPITGAEVDEFDVDAFIADVEAKDAQPGFTKEKFMEGNNRQASMKGYNVPDALLPAALRLNPAQTAPSNPFEGWSNLAIPGRLAERGF